MVREQLVRQIAAIDEEINKEAAAHRVPSLNLKHRTFPFATWISAIFFLAFWLFGSHIAAAYFEWAPLIFLVLGALFTLSGIWRTMMWVVKRNQKVDAGYAEGSARIRALRAEREELQQRLNEMK